MYTAPYILAASGQESTALAHIAGDKSGLVVVDHAIERASEEDIDHSPQDMVTTAFRSGESEWMEEPVIQEWARRPLPILREVNRLYHHWMSNPPGPFDPFSDPLWRTTMDVLRKVGLPWHNNNLNSPEEVDPSWPFQFKHYEKRAVVAKGHRVGDAQAFGYVTGWDEANQYGIRSLQHELRHQAPEHRPLLVGFRIEVEILRSAAQMFGLEMLQICDGWEAAEAEVKQLTNGRRRPVIVAATMASRIGQADDFCAIGRFLKACPGLLHVDASRTFDYITSLAPTVREREGVPHLLLRHMHLDSDFENPNVVYASTIVAAGMNWSSQPPCIVLRPRTLGNAPAPMVEYVRGADDTLAGSRDSLGPLVLCIQELRFGVDECRQIYDACRKMRKGLFDTLVKHRVSVDMPVASLDLVLSLANPIHLEIQNQLGLASVVGCRGKYQYQYQYLLTVQPSVSAVDIQALVEAICGDKTFSETILSLIPAKHDFPVPEDVLSELQQTVSQWRAAAPSSGGFPLNQATYSALGPVLGYFLSIPIPPQWTTEQMDRMMTAQKRQFGVPEHKLEDFVGGFTSGGTMGNRVGLYTGLKRYPEAFVYYSSASHYSVKKIVRDNDRMNGRWCVDKQPRYAEIDADELGRMKADALLEQVLLDRSYCHVRRKKYTIILVANIGTTFTGGQDDILALRRALRSIGSDTSYILADGALDLGFSSELVQLGPAEMLLGKGGAPVVQAVTLSHHKAFGVMVSGEVICHLPNTTERTLATMASLGDPRAVFETWLVQQLYPAKDLARIHGHCLGNAQLLRRLLSDARIDVRFNEESLITILERVPSWLMYEFHLAPEGDWVHFITMPHITSKAVHRFVQSITCLATLFQSMLDEMRPRIEAVLGNGGFDLVRVRSQSSYLFAEVLALAESLWEEGLLEDLVCQSVEIFKREYIYGCMSFAVVDARRRPLIVFLAHTSPSREVWPGPVLIGRGTQYNMTVLHEIARNAFRFMSERLAGS